MKTNFNQFNIKAVNVGTTNKPFNKLQAQNVYQYKVTVINNESKKQATFNFYDSINNYQNNKTELSTNDLFFAFYCFVSDSFSAEQYDAYTFMHEFGYTSLVESNRIYKACLTSLNKLQRIYDGDICELLNELQEQNDF